MAIETSTDTLCIIVTQYLELNIRLSAVFNISLNIGGFVAGSDNRHFH